jgi:predicted permease
LVATLGGAVGVFSAWVAFQLAAGFLPPLAIDLTPDTRVLAFVISVTFATAGAFGLAPAFLATKVDLISSLKDDNIRGYRRSRLRSGMIVAQIAVSVLLLSVSGLFLRSLTNAATTNPGFNSDNLLLVGVTLPDYKEPRGIELFQQMLERLRPLPGVTAVSLVNRAGLDFDGMRRNVRFEGYTSQPGEDMEVAFNLAGPRYLETMQTPVQRGRDFNEGDRKGATAVAIVNETLARRYFPNQEDIGKRLSVSGPQGPFVEIVGIACDGKYWSLFEEPRPFFSLAILQEYQGYVNVVLRTDGDPSRLIETVRSQILALDPKLLIENITTMNDHIAAGLLPLRIASIASMVFGALALLLSGLGIYGLVAYLA